MTQLLLGTMKKTSRESNVEGRIVNVSSEGHRFAYREGIRFDKINDESVYVVVDLLSSCYVLWSSLLNLEANLLTCSSLSCAGIAALEHMGSQSLQTSCTLMNSPGNSRYVLHSSSA